MPPSVSSRSRYRPLTLAKCQSRSQAPSPSSLRHPSWSREDSLLITIRLDLASGWVAASVRNTRWTYMHTCIGNISDNTRPRITYCTRSIGNVSHLFFTSIIIIFSNHKPPGMSVTLPEKTVGSKISQYIRDNISPGGIKLCVSAKQETLSYPRCSSTSFEYRGEATIGT